MDFKQPGYVDRLEIKLNDEQEGKLNAWINHKKTSIEEDRESFLSRSQKFMFNWDDFITFIRKGPWEGSSNLHMPLTSIAVKTYHARLYNIFSAQNTTTFSPRESSDNTSVEIAQKLRNWYMWDYLNEYKGIRGVTRELCYDAVTVGFGVAMMDWMVKQRKVIDVEENELIREMADLGPQVEDVAKEVLEAEGFMTEEEEMKAKVDVKPYKEVQKSSLSLREPGLELFPLKAFTFLTTSPNPTILIILLV